ncbi:DUF1697 domain-containing protein [Flavobacterium album]|uniref:DUF1697 domain-containing protein n=1 Tax=Flavobacterium album TaxID=2175091 RepID=A0A2S1R0T2_9FLAO|nr:DUF1697 domain-containing protein [Flavobacterium album]AWH86244.1 DUF1697 domain-containing protein [Flavobacterium album]
MPAYLALLRGINVSGKKIIKMEDLRKLMESAGYGNVKTYIQSGNVIFSSVEKSKEKLAEAIEKLIEGQYGFDVSVFVVDKNDLDKAVDNNPFTEGKVPEEAGTKKIYVTFLSEVPSEESMEKLRQAPIGDDVIALHENILYFRLAIGAADSKLSNNLIESKLKLKATTRNWNTTLKLLEMLENT